jgi:subtilisin family serine protease
MRLTSLALKRALSRVATPVIVQTHPNRLTEVFEEVRQYEFRLVPGMIDKILGEVELPLYETRIMPTFSMFAMILPREVIFDLAEDSRVVKIYSDELKYALQYPTVPKEGVYVLEHKLRKKKVEFTSTYWTKRLIGADVANTKGFRGRGVKVAVLDTGASTIHEQLSGRIYKLMTVYPAAYIETNGHGTWCTACVGGRLVKADTASRLVGKDVLCEGMAPESTLYAIKVLGFVIGTGSDSAIIKGIEWAIQEGANILSMSLGGPVNVKDPKEDPFYEVFTKVVSQGIIPVVAAGNEGPDAGTIGTPGWLEEVLTVGAYDPITGAVAEYSSRGPTPDGRIKPDVIAPGGGYPDHGIENAIVNLLDKAGDGMPDRYSPIQGTSMATPHVAGLVTLMFEAHQKVIRQALTVNEIKQMMMELGHEKTNDDGWGLITWQLYERWLETQYGVKL